MATVTISLLLICFESTHKLPGNQKLTAEMLALKLSLITAAEVGNQLYILSRNNVYYNYRTISVSFGHLTSQFG